MTKNDINLLQKRKNKQYSTKSLLLTVVIVIIFGGGLLMGITLPTKNLADTKAALTSMQNELQMYSGVALSAGDGEDATDAYDAGLDTVYIAKTKTLNSLEEELESLMILATAESDALVYIKAIEECLPSKVNLTSLIMSNNSLSIYGTASSDASIAAFTLRLRESELFNNVFVSSSMASMPGEQTSIFNLTATLSESLDTKPIPQLTTGDTKDGATNLEAKNEGF